MRHGYWHHYDRKTLRPVRGGHVIYDYTAYLAAVRDGSAACWWIIRGDEEWAARLARQALHAAKKALGEN